MKIAAAILSRFAGDKSETTDVFDLRLASMGTEHKSCGDRPALPALFTRAARQAA